MGGLDAVRTAIEAFRHTTDQTQPAPHDVEAGCVGRPRVNTDDRIRAGGCWSQSRTELGGAWQPWPADLHVYRSEHQGFGLRGWKGQRQVSQDEQAHPEDLHPT
ncbi:hypothetical protein, partial [Streptomyces avermitilis]|uniref:hypothetical protein n=1 Tax=Streptomyces avermitilis TaxID=33903 RepID=UPI0034069EB1